MCFFCTRSRQHPNQHAHTGAYSSTICPTCGCAAKGFNTRPGSQENIRATKQPQTHWKRAGKPRRQRSTEQASKQSRKQATARASRQVRKHTVSPPSFETSRSLRDRVCALLSVTAPAHIPKVAFGLCGRPVSGRRRPYAVTPHSSAALSRKEHGMQKSRQLLPPTLTSKSPPPAPPHTRQLQNNYITTTKQLHNNLHNNYTTTHFYCRKSAYQQ